MKLARRFKKRTSELDQRIRRTLRQHLDGDLPSALKGWAELGVKHPHDPRIHFFASLAAYSAKDLDLAEQLMRNCIELQPTNYDALYNLGKFLEEMQRPMEAMDCYLSALQANPQHPESLNNLGGLYLSLGDFDTAEACYAQALAVETAHPDALYNRSFLKLLKGDLRGGFADYEQRWKCPGFAIEYRRDFMRACPPWDGGDLKGKTLLLMAEQGFGDTLQFWRYVPHLLDRVGPFVAEVQGPLYELLAYNTDARVTLVRRGDELPHFDVWVSTMSLPYHFDGAICETTFPYLTPDRVEAA